jgi:hypothetical protein
VCCLRIYLDRQIGEAEEVASEDGEVKGTEVEREEERWRGKKRMRVKCLGKRDGLDSDSDSVSCSCSCYSGSSSNSNSLVFLPPLSLPLFPLPLSDLVFILNFAPLDSFGS